MMRAAAHCKKHCNTEVSIRVHMPALYYSGRCVCLTGKAPVHNYLACYRKVTSLCLSKSRGQLNTLTGINILYYAGFA